MDNAYRSLAAVYDRFMADVDYNAWADYLIGLLGAPLRSEPVRVIECGCGTGAITLQLLQKGMDVTGIDISPEMLRVAQEKLRSAGYKNAALACMDMRALSSHRPVDAVVAACDGVNYLLSDEDAAHFFAGACRALKPDGLLLFDISSAHKLRRVLDGHTFGEDLADCAYLWQNVYDDASGLLQMDLTVFTREPDGRYARAEETHMQRAYETEELRELLVQNGFDDIETFDAFTKDPPRPDSERIQFQARRRTDG